MKRCAYCNIANEKFTREHIWPANILRKCESLLTYNPKNENFHKGEPVIKDVCGQCNNSHLSKIGVYLADLFDHYFADYIEVGQPADLTYEYNTLLRGLLKFHIIQYDQQQMKNRENCYHDSQSRSFEAGHFRR